MAFSAVFANDLAKLILQAVPIANLADNAAASPLTEFYAALHSAAPGDAQTDDEASYTGYVRVSIARTVGGWVVTGNVANPAADILFPAVTGGGGEVTHWSVGTALSGAGKVLMAGLLMPSQQIITGMQPRVSSASALTFKT